MLPLGACLLLVVAGLLLAAGGRRRTGHALAALAVAWLWIASTPPVSRPLQAWLEGVHPARPASALPGSDAAAVLGGGISPPMPPRRELDLGDGADRVFFAARLYREGKVPRLMLSGGSPLGDPVPSEASAMRLLLRRLDVPDAALVLDESSRDTFENCRAIARAARERAWRRVLLVTSALHMPRALATCRAAGVPAVPAATDVRAVRLPFRLADLAPDAEALAGTGRVVHELLGIVDYAARGRLDAGPLLRELLGLGVSPDPAPAPSP